MTDAAVRKAQQTGSQSGRRFQLETGVMSALHSKLGISAKYFVFETKERLL